MAYSELVKNFERIRDYMRQFYVYGFKSRESYAAKSARSYDNERRRIESWLGDYMAFRSGAGGKRVFISVDSRAIVHNPLYSAFKAKSFTVGDVMFHFYVLDILSLSDRLTCGEIFARICADYLSFFEKAAIPDESSIRKKLKEYETLGVLRSEKHGRELIYSRSPDAVDLDNWREAVSFFSEEHPLGVVGSYILDKYDCPPDLFRFKHHYILNALDSQILYSLALAIGEKRRVELALDDRAVAVCPSKLFISTQSGRQYLLCYDFRPKRPVFFRLDSLRAAKPLDPEPDFDKFDELCAAFRGSLWGVSSGRAGALEHIELTIHIGEGEEYVAARLERERRRGRVERLDEHTCRFSADVCDAGELLPWIRTFIGRITALECSNRHVVETFMADLDELRQMYGGESDAVQ